MADILPFHQDRTPAPDGEPEPLWREVLDRSLRATRETQGGRRVDIAERAGISPQYLSEIERGRKEPSSEMIAAVAGALGVGLPDLLAGSAAARVPQSGAIPRDPCSWLPETAVSGAVVEDVVREPVADGARRVEHAVPVGVVPQVRDLATGVC